MLQIKGISELSIGKILYLVFGSDRRIFCYPCKSCRAVKCFYIPFAFPCFDIFHRDTSLILHCP